MSHAALRNSRSSPLAEPINCTPSGSPDSPSSKGTHSEGSPQSAQIRQKTGSPGSDSIDGGSPPAAGATTAS